MAFFLLIESATDRCSIGIAQGNTMLCEVEEEIPYSHTESITLLIEKALELSNIRLDQIGCVAVSQGPGSYTALRVGTSVAKGICYALNIPLIGVDTLRSLAIAAVEDQDKLDFLYCPMIDARRMEVYCSVYDKNGKRIEPLQAKVLDEQSFSEWKDLERYIVFQGNGSSKFKNIVSSSFFIFRDYQCRASYLLPEVLEAFQEKRFESVAFFEPTYFKAPNITTPKKFLR